ncbi:MAG TPA: nuclear transport factor 2 family protein [bacterium]|nr:nuclear transport factor 2 family protein [bacterium]
MSSEKKEVYRSFFESMYHWFETIIDDRVPFDRNRVAQWWRPDGKMITNGVELYVGFDSLNDHWEQLKGHFTALKVSIPFIEYIEAGDKVIIEYTIEGTNKDGQDGTVYDLAVFTLVDGKIAVMREIAHIEGFESFKLDR